MMEEKGIIPVTQEGLVAIVNSPEFLKNARAFKGPRSHFQVHQDLFSERYWVSRPVKGQSVPELFKLEDLEASRGPDIFTLLIVGYVPSFRLSGEDLLNSLTTLNQYMSKSAKNRGLFVNPILFLGWKEQGNASFLLTQEKELIADRVFSNKVAPLKELDKYPADSIRNFLNETKLYRATIVRVNAAGLMEEDSKRLVWYPFKPKINSARYIDLEVLRAGKEGISAAGQEGADYMRTLMVQLTQIRNSPDAIAAFKEARGIDLRTPKGLEKVMTTRGLDFAYNRDLAHAYEISLKSKK